MTTAHDLTRRDEIAEYRVLSDPPRNDLEAVVRLAATLCDVSTAVINVIDDRFQHQIAALGMEPAVCSREDSMCAVVLDRPGRVVVRDARQDERFAQNPFVTGEIGRIRFYASSPLITPAGIAIGTLCVFAEEPGTLSPERAEALDLLAHQVVEALELRRATRELAASNQELTLFASQVSHDLRNPLTALAGFLELATDSPDLVNAPQVARWLDRAEATTGRMTTMVDELLDFARVGGARPSRTAVDLADIVRTALEDLDAALVRTGADVRVDASARLFGDPTLLRALVQNLIANAVKFAAASGITPLVEVQADELPDGWRLSVDDNGPGVPPELRERVFALMARGAAGGVDGLGIGLATCRRIVDAHGGRIGIDDSPLGGARVWVVLPAGPVAPH